MENGIEIAKAYEFKLFMRIRSGLLVNVELQQVKW